MKSTSDSTAWTRRAGASLLMAGALIFTVACGPRSTEDGSTEGEDDAVNIGESGEAGGEPAAIEWEAETASHLFGGTEPVINLSRWLEASGRTAPARLSDNRWRIGGEYTEILLTPGTRQVGLNGQLLWLGFPFLADSEGLYVTERDFQATLQPLLAPQPVWRPNQNHIVIDPGHGGRDSGSVGPGVYEKGMTLDVAQRLATLLRAKGWRVDLTRGSDVSMSLRERVDISNELDPDLFISLHFNSFSDASVQGIETLIQTPKGLPSFLTRGSTDDRTLEYPSNEYDAESFSVAWLVQRSLLLKTRAVDRGVKTARIMGVLRYQYCPAMIIEGGFLSHETEGARIANRAYRETIAGAIADALPARDPRAARLRDDTLVDLEPEGPSASETL